MRVRPRRSKRRSRSTSESGTASIRHSDTRIPQRCASESATASQRRSRRQQHAQIFLTFVIGNDVIRGGEEARRRSDRMRSVRPHQSEAESPRAPNTLWPVVAWNGPGPSVSAGSSAYRSGLASSSSRIRRSRIRAPWRPSSTACQRAAAPRAGQRRPERTDRSTLRLSRRATKVDALRKAFRFESKSDAVTRGVREYGDALNHAKDEEQAGVDSQRHRGITAFHLGKRDAADERSFGHDGGGNSSPSPGIAEVRPELREGALHRRRQNRDCPRHGITYNKACLIVNKTSDIYRT